MAIPEIMVNQREKEVQRALGQSGIQEDVQPDVKERHDMPFIHFVKSRGGITLAKIVTEEFRSGDEKVVCENADFIIRPLLACRGRIREDCEIIWHNKESGEHYRVGMINSSGWKDRSWRHTTFHSLVARRVRRVNQRLGVIPSGNILRSVILPARNP